jgi:N-acetylmuramoyl-L-alanine amidase
LGSRHEGQIDPGANVKGKLWDEDFFTLYISKRLVADLEVLFRGTHGKVMLRNAGPFYRADDAAAQFGADIFIENHLNAGGGTGTEVLYEDSRDRPEATAMSEALAAALKLRDRGAKRSTDIAVLQPHSGMVQLLIEWFFADSKKDVEGWYDNRHRAELAVLNQILAMLGWRKVKSLPRVWSKARRRLYRPY